MALVQVDRPSPVSPDSTREPGVARAFAQTRGLSEHELRAAPLRWPRPSALRAPLDVPVGRMADAVAALHLRDVGDLLEHLPRDRREARTVSTLAPGEQATVAVQVRSIASRPVRRRNMRPLVQATVFDETGSMRVTFFNQPWLLSRYPAGTRLLLHGKAEARGGFRVSHHAEVDAATVPAARGLPGDDPQPSRERAGTRQSDQDQGVLPEPHGGAPEGAVDGHGTHGVDQMVSHYPAAEGITSTQILGLVRGARAHLTDVPEPLPGRLRAAEGLPDRAAALAAMHFPRDGAQPERARQRLAFEELLLVQLMFLRRRSQRRARVGALALDGAALLSARWSQSLPFVLTHDQREAMVAIEGDLAQRRPMQRLLMGEVGAGKTVVAVHAMLRAVEHGHQAALMAPTETLAEQHFATLQRLMAHEPVPCALLTGSTPARRRADVLGKLRSGELSLLVGTHALIEPDVRFRSLAVVVIDEQHRFGVRQRAALDAKGSVGCGSPDGVGGAPGDERAALSGGAETRAPHVLHMTATPIPRTLALAGYGDLDVTELHALPGGRRPIRTAIVATDASRGRAYAHLCGQLREGRQAFVVCPLISEADAPTDASATGRYAETRAATAEYERLSAHELAGFRLRLLHGQMPAREKQQAMAAFAAGEADVLVATTVIEVGIDVPNATVMLIENAERFGISQLHQLRGRIGRGEHASTCLLVGPPGSSRLQALARHHDGFRLAEIDLELRKEGELVGTRQSGLGQFRVARLPEDGELLARARLRAQEIMADDPELRSPVHALLARALAQAFGPEQLGPIPA